MSDPIRAAVKPLFFDATVIKKGALCTVLNELPDGMGGVLLEVMFADGVKRFVRKDDVEVPT